jgi:hypothetical protein
MILMMKIYSIINLHEKLIYFKIINLFFYSISKFDCYSEYLKIKKESNFEFRKKVLN